MDNFQKSFASQCYCGSLLVCDKLYRHRNAVRRSYPRCTQRDEAVLHVLVQCSSNADLWVYVEPLLSRVGRIQLLAEDCPAIRL